jgi:dolichyl-phosphate-mannose--protein O-mannosyl transferase
MLLFIAIGLGANYLTWVLIPRSTFIYHYFASLPFIMIFTVYIFKQLYKRYGKPVVFGIIAFFVVAVLLFALFYTVWSGMTVSREFVENFVRWFGSWYFYN